MAVQQQCTWLVQGMQDELERVKDERDSALEEVAKLDEALAAVQNGPNVELMQAWDTERRELLQDLEAAENRVCLLYTSPSPRDRQKSRMPSSA